MFGPVAGVRPAVRDGVRDRAEDRAPGGARVQPGRDELGLVRSGVYSPEAVVLEERAVHQPPDPLECTAPRRAVVSILGDRQDPPARADRPRVRPDVARVAIGGIEGPFESKATVARNGSTRFEVFDAGAGRLR